MIMGHFVVLIIFISILFSSLPAETSAQSSQVRDIVFPILSDGTSFSYRDDFGEPRSGHTHEGVDIIAAKMTPLIAVVDGEVRSINYPEASWGYAVILSDSEGYRYWYLHINNDTPGTDNGAGGELNAYAPYIERRFDVKKGQIIGWMGDSGNAETTASHLHFEIHTPDGSIINPYESLQRAQRLAAPVVPPQQDDEFLPFGEFSGGTSVSVGNFNISNNGEFVAGAGPGGGPHVRIMDLNDKPLGAFYAYDENFRGGVDVATGDMDGDGIDEIITAPGPGGGPHVKIFKSDGTAYSTEGFFAFDPGFSGGVRVATADLDGDNKDEIIVAAGPGGGPHVRIFNGDGTIFSEGFFAFDAAFRGGLDVAALGETNNADARIIVSAGPGGGPHVKIFNIQGQELSDFYAYDEEFRGGVRLTARRGQNGFSSSSNASATIITAPAMDGGPDFKEFNLEGDETDSDSAFERWWQGGYDIAADENMVLVSSGNGRLSYMGARRASMWEIF